MIVGYESLLTGPRETGVGLVVGELLQGLASMRDDVRLVVYVTPKSRWRLPEGEHIEYRTSRFARVCRATRIMWQQLLAPRLDARRVDLYHATGYVLSGFPFAVPTVVSIYDTTALEYPRLTRWPNAVHFKFAMPRGARAAGSIIVPTRHAACRVEALLGTKTNPIYVIPPGVAQEFTAPRTTKPAGKPQEPYLLFVGNLERKKNLPFLVRLLKELRSRGNNVRLVLAGAPGNAAGELAALAKAEGVQEAITFTGYLKRYELAGLYRNALMLLYPSLDEGFGLPPVEAMACGTPVVASNAGAIPEVTAGAATLLDPRDAGAWIEAVEGLMKNRECLDRLRELGFERAREFTWERTTRKVVDVYKETIARDSREVHVK